jgi:hypothetical protein
MVTSGKEVLVQYYYKTAAEEWRFFQFLAALYWTAGAKG